ncbi:arylesterase [Salinimicrobium gaetbulicola]|uniref:Arylesterase n=1 Tax=Salinimicrobium gaetbulicola TaxID=999702 RepID=A0ABW3IIB2_9FLAO
MRNLNPLHLLFVIVLFLSCGDQKQEQEKPVEEKENKEQSNEEGKTKTILFFGDSLTAGMGLDPNEAFPAVIQARLDSLGFKYNVVNAGLSGETTASGKNRVDWVLNQEVDIFVLELGANDGLRGISPEETRKNLQEIIDHVLKKYPDSQIILAGMQIPPNMGPEYTAAFRSIFPDLAEKNEVKLIPFLLEEVAGNLKLNQEDGIHPTAEGHRILAENVWNVLQPMLKK